ncbi:MAG: sodium:proton antiporter NhaD, partial [Flavobacteriales bacterium]
MAFWMMVVVFVVGYTAIALEHPIKINKAASAILTGVVCWTVLILGADTIFGIDLSQSVSDFIAGAEHYTKDLGKFLEEYKPGADDTTSLVASHFISERLLHHLGDIASILFFLLGAMTIVEMVDAHEGFRIITDKITTTNKVKLMWLVSWITFFLSAALDNLTTSIVMAALLRKLMKDQKDLWIFGGLVIIAANAGGAWSPIGDVTTIMLWIGGQVTTVSIIAQLLLPSMVCLTIPLLILSFTSKGEVNRPLGMLEREHLVDPTTPFERVFLLCLGVGSLLFVPVFKTFTHLPPYMGILLGLGVVWVATEVIHRSKATAQRTKLTVVGVLQKVDTPSVFFFL